MEWIRKTWNLILPRDDYQAEKVRAIAVTVGGGHRSVSLCFSNISGQLLRKFGGKQYAYKEKT